MNAADPRAANRLLPDAAADLPGIELILEAQRLRERFPEALPGPVRAGYLRFKPGVSATARLDLLDDDGLPTGEIRWVGVYSPRSGKKIAKARRRAQRLYGTAGRELMEVRDLPGHPGHRVVLGRIAADPKLAGCLRSALGERAFALGTAGSGVPVLRFNPQRRVVVTLDGGRAAAPSERPGDGERSAAGPPVVAKITALPSAVDPLLVQRLSRSGVPVHPLVPCHGTEAPAASEHLRCSEWFGDGDLAALARREALHAGNRPGDRTGSAARAAGAGLALLHGARLRPGPSRTDGGSEGEGDPGPGRPAPPDDPVSRLRAMGTDMRTLDAGLADRFADLAAAAVARIEASTMRSGAERQAGPGLGGFPHAVSEQALLHGDFSADQVLVDSGRCGDAAGGAGETRAAVVLTDLERMRWGRSADDLGNMVAVEILEGLSAGGPAGPPDDLPEAGGGEHRTPVAEAVMAGYRDQAALLHRNAPPEAEICAWAAYHLLLRAMGPFRNCSPDWRAETARILDVVTSLVHEDAGAPPRTAEAAACSGASTALVPATLPDPQDPRQHLTVVRAWPKGDGRMTAELLDADGRVRAARGVPESPDALTWTVAPYGEDPRLPALTGLSRSGRLVVHRHGRRAVVALPDRYVKVLARGAAAEVARGSRGLYALATSAGFTAPRVLAHDEDTVEFSVLPGRSLHALGMADQRDAYLRGLHAWARRWPRLVTADPAPFELPEFTVADEIRTLETWVARVGMFPGILAVPQEQLAALRDGVARELSALPADGGTTRGVLHRDLHEKQLLAHGDSIGVLDFDTAAVGDPALDLANLGVHLELHRDQGVLSPSLHEEGQRVVHEVASGLGVPSARLHAYGLSARLRLVCVYAFRPRWRELAAARARSLEITAP